jgi:hypothetical protein
MRLVLLVALLLIVGGSGGLTFVLTNVDVDGAPRRLDAADLDGDGDIDLFVLADGDGQSASLQVLRNDGGTFSSGWSALESADSDDLPWDVNLADTDGDGDRDVLYVHPAANPRERFNDGAGNFPTTGFIDSFSQRAQQEPADTDENGDVDLVYLEADIVGYFGTMKGKGDGTFDWDVSTETIVPGSADTACRFVLGDVTGDGWPDAAMASINGLQFMRGEGPDGGSTLPGFIPSVLKLYPKACLDVVLVDLNGDGRLDIVASVPSSNCVAVLVTRASGQPGPARLFSAGTAPDAIAAADLDLDGNSDVVAANPTTKSVTVLRGTGSGGLFAPASLTVGRRPTDIVAADLDDDGDTDLAVTCALDGAVSVLLNDSL